MTRTDHMRTLSPLSQRVTGQHRRRHDERGAAVVEGALVFGLFMFIIFMIIEFGMFFRAWSTGRNAATEAAHLSSVAGRAGDADYQAMRSVRQTLSQLQNKADYIIIYRASGIKSTVPPECIEQAEMGKADIANGDLLIPHGKFKSGAHTVETFPWDGDLRPEIACNIYYPEQIQTLAKDAFVYERDEITSVPPEPSLDRFWPGGYRVDRLTGPVDFLGVYMQHVFTSPTGLLGERTLKHNSIIQIESRRT